MLDAPADGGADVVEVGVEPASASRSSGPPSSRVGAAHELAVVLGVAFLDQVAATRRAQLLEPVVAERLEQAEPGAAAVVLGHDQRAGHQVVDHVDHVGLVERVGVLGVEGGTQPLGRGQIEATRADRQPIEEHPLTDRQWVTSSSTRSSSCRSRWLSGSRWRSIVNAGIRGSAFFRAAFYFPSLASSVAIMTIAVYILSSDGLLNHLIGSNRSWFTDEGTALWSIVGLNAWTTSGTIMLFYLAALQAISTDVYEAAAIDGTSTWRVFRKITFPLCAPRTSSCSSSSASARSSSSTRPSSSPAGREGRSTRRTPPCCTSICTRSSPELRARRLGGSRALRRHLGADARPRATIGRAESGDAADVGRSGRAVVPRAVHELGSPGGRAST